MIYFSNQNDSKFKALFLNILACESKHDTDKYRKSGGAEPPRPLFIRLCGVEIRQKYALPSELLGDRNDLIEEGHS